MNCPSKSKEATFAHFLMPVIGYNLIKPNEQIWEKVKVLTWSQK